MGRKRKDYNNKALNDNEYQRSNGSYEYRWTDLSGKRCSIYAKDLQELREREKEIKINSYMGISLTANDMTINDIWHIWIRTRRKLKRNSLSSYNYSYHKHIENDIGQFKISAIKKSTVKAFYNRLQEEVGLKLHTIQNIHNQLYQILQMAVEDDLIRRNPCEGALRDLSDDETSTARHALTLQQQLSLEAFLNTPDAIQYKWYPIVVTLLRTGLRIGECTGLTWNDIDFQRKEIHIRRTLIYGPSPETNFKGSFGYAVQTPKSASGKRVIPMSDVVVNAIRLEKQFQELRGIKEKKGCVAGCSGFVFLSVFGKPHLTSSLNQVLNRIVERYNNENPDNPLPHISCHLLRHTAATRMCEAQMNVKAIQEILGHSKFQTTMNIYTEATLDFRHDEIISLDQYLSKKLTTKFTTNRLKKVPLPLIEKAE